jgi:Flp pilus assembly protein TadD
MKVISLPSRCAVAAVSVCACFALFHGEIAAALVTRGDALVSRGHAESAAAYYGRALSFDRGSPIVADRIAFAAFATHSDESLQRAVTVASLGLRYHPNDENLLVDRALSLQALRRRRSALVDFTQAARSTRNPTYAIFAAWDALAIGEGKRARRLWSFARVLGAPESLSPFGRRTAPEHAK